MSVYKRKETLPISLDPEVQLISMYHDKDYNSSWCKNLKIGREN